MIKKQTSTESTHLNHIRFWSSYIETRRPNKNQPGCSGSESKSNKFLVKIEKLNSSNLSSDYPTEYFLG